MNRYLTTTIGTITTWYNKKNRWWLPLICGLFYTICHSPFNHETHPLLLFFPLTAFIVVIPLLLFSLAHPLKKALLHSYLFGITASFTQFYWISNVVIRDLWPIIMVGLGLLTLFIALLYLLYGILFRFCLKEYSFLSILIFPSFWILIEYVRTIGDISFPWAFNGYALTPLLALSQFASLTGVYGLSFLIIVGNVSIVTLLQAHYKKQGIRATIRFTGIFLITLGLITLWGALRLRNHKNTTKTIRISLIQNNIDQKQWNGTISLDTSMAINEQLVYTSKQEDPDLILFPESGVFCYLERQVNRKNKVLEWSRFVQTPMILGTLHWEKMKEDPFYKYKVYNSVFSLESDSQSFQHYHKIKLVPFSEALPFEGLFPILSRINLGESDFHRGKEEKIFHIKDTFDYFAAPFLCYEIIYPEFVRKRVQKGATLLLNLTNDGWFGFSTAPYHHAAMARLRSIENGVSLARCANSGISLLVDPVGRVIEKSNLYERRVITGDLSLQPIPTMYKAYGNWFLWLALITCCGSLLYSLRKKIY